MLNQRAGDKKINNGPGNSNIAKKTEDEETKREKKKKKLVYRII